MKPYLWTMLVLHGLCTLGRLLWIAQGRLPNRTMGATAFDAVAGALFCAWSAYLLMEVAYG